MDLEGLIAILLRSRKASFLNPSAYDVGTDLRGLTQAYENL